MHLTQHISVCLFSYKQKIKKVKSICWFGLFPHYTHVDNHNKLKKKWKIKRIFLVISNISLIFNVKKKIGGGVTYNGHGSSYLSKELMTFML